MKPHITRWQDTRGFKFGAGIGAMVLTYVGAAWAFAAVANRPATRTWEYAVLTLPVLTLTAWGVMRFVAIARLPIDQLLGVEVIESARQGRRVGRWFAVIFAVEIISVALTAVILARTGQPLLIPVAVVAIVGAHFLPLARVFHIPTYGFAGVLLVGASLGSLLIGDELARVFVLGLATALVLWASAGVVLAIHSGRYSAIRAV